MLRDAGCDLRLRNLKGKTPAYMATKYGHTDCSCFLSLLPDGATPSKEETLRKMKVPELRDEYAAVFDNRGSKLRKQELIDALLQQELLAEEESRKKSTNKKKKKEISTPKQSTK